MQNYNLNFMLLLITIILLLISNGCSSSLTTTIGLIVPPALGYKIGSSIDKSKPAQTSVPVSNITGIEAGTKIGITMKDGDSLTCKYRGLHQVLEDEYANRYAKFIEEKAGEAALPVLKDTILVILNSGEQLKCEFHGVNFRVIAVRKAGSDELHHLLINSVGKMTDSKGNIIDRDFMQNLIYEVNIPLLSEISVEIDNKKNRVPVENIKQVYVLNEKRHSGKIYGLLVGIGIDLGFLVWFNAAVNP